jgi:hypothetical protein
MKTKKIIVPYVYLARVAALRLIKESCWFAVTPMPDDQFGFEVKDEPKPVEILGWFKQK